MKSKVTSAYLTAGKASFITTNALGESYKFTVEKATSPKYGEIFWLYFNDDGKPKPVFLGVLTEKAVKLTNGSSIHTLRNQKAFAVAGWAIRQIRGNKDLPNGYSIKSNGCCGRCGIKLKSLAEGRNLFGKGCQKKVTQVKIKMNRPDVILNAHPSSKFLREE